MWSNPIVTLQPHELTSKPRVASCDLAMWTGAGLMMDLQGCCHHPSYKLLGLQPALRKDRGSMRMSVSLPHLGLDVNSSVYAC